MLTHPSGSIHAKGVHIAPFLTNPVVIPYFVFMWLFKTSALNGFSPSGTLRFAPLETAHAVKTDGKSIEINVE